VERIAQRVIHVDRAGKPGLLAEVLREKSWSACWSSPAPNAAPTRSFAALAKAGLASEAIHGNKSQNQRERVLAAFRAGHVRTLVATDIAARGIDVDGISHVINYDLPNIPES
jgi:superfamily II DNA/RNA helicase